MIYPLGSFATVGWNFLYITVKPIVPKVWFSSDILLIFCLDTLTVRYWSPPIVYGSPFFFFFYPLRHSIPFDQWVKSIYIKVDSLVETYYCHLNFCFLIHFYLHCTFFLLFQITFINCWFSMVIFSFITIFMYLSLGFAVIQRFTFYIS